MREHRCFTLQFRLNENVGYNRDLSSGIAQTISRRQIPASRRRVRSPRRRTTSIGFFKTRPDLDRPDAQVLMAPWTAAPVVPGKALGLEREPGLQCIGFIGRPDSEGSVRITSSDPDAPLDITTNYFTSPHDREVGIAIFRKMREMFAAEPIAERLDHGDAPRARRSTTTIASSTPGSTTATAGTTPSARVPWARPTTMSSTPNCACGASTACESMDCLGHADDGVRQPQRADHGHGLAGRRPHPRRN